MSQPQTNFVSSCERTSFVYIKGDNGKRIGVVAFRVEDDQLQVGASFLNPNDTFDPVYGRDIADMRLRERPAVTLIPCTISNRQLVRAALTLATRDRRYGSDPVWKGISGSARNAVRKLYSKR